MSWASLGPNSKIDNGKVMAYTEHPAKPSLSDEIRKAAVGQWQMKIFIRNYQLWNKLSFNCYRHPWYCLIYPRGPVIPSDVRPSIVKLFNLNQDGDELILLNLFICIFIHLNKRYLYNKIWRGQLFMTNVFMKCFVCREK